MAVILAVPMYANAAGIVPVVEVFVAKGVSLSTALAIILLGWLFNLTITAG